MRYRSHSGRVYARLGINALEVSQRSIDAWKRHDADALAAVYAEGGTYHNPRFDHPLTGQAIADFAKSVWAAYPDMGENSRNGNLCTLRLGLLYFWESKRPKTSRGNSLVGVPHVVSSQIEMLPAQRRQMF